MSNNIRNSSKNQIILIITNRLSTGGVAKISKHVAELAVKQFKKVYVMPLYETDENTGYPFEVVNIVLDTLSRNFYSKIQYNILLMRTIRKTVNKLNPDVICSFSSDVNVRTILACKGLKNYFIACERGDPRNSNFIWRTLINYCYKHCDCAIFQTKIIAELFAKKCFRRIIIPNPCIIDEIDNSIKANDDLCVVSVGRLVKEKNYVSLIKSFSIIAPMYSNCKLMIYGDGPLKEELSQLIHQLQMNEKIKLMGHHTKVNNEISRATLFVLTSISEGIPNSLLEAMGLGIPVITTDCPSGGCAMLTDNGRRGILIPVNDDEALKDAITTMLNNKELRRKYSELALEVNSDYKPELIDNLWLKALSKQ